MPNPPSDMDTIPDELKSWYRESLTSRIEALEAARRELSAGSEEVTESIRRIAHSLRGSGETYGFPEVSQAAAIVEDSDNTVIAQKADCLIDVCRTVAGGTGGRVVTMLVVDDDPAVFRILERKLAGPSRRLLWAADGRQAEKLLRQDDVALIVLDLILPDTDGRSLLLKLRQTPKTAATPVIVLSGLVNSQTKTECFALGADDYFEKPFNPEMIAAAISAKLVRLHGLSEESRRDPLTNLPNRAAFHEMYQTISSLTGREKQALCLAVVDFDHFKSVNDLHGHAKGDEVLCRAARVIAMRLRKSDVVARWGGDEFVVLLPNTPIPGALHALERALEAFREETFAAEDDQPFHVTFSAGLVEVDQDEALEQAVGHADALLYCAKAEGRSCVMTEQDGRARKKGTVLLAEDDDMTASLIKNRLIKEGFEVLHFTDGAEALEGAPETGVSIAILDVKMPGMNGFGLLEEFRKRPAYHLVPMVVLTSMGREEDVVRGLELGADDYILKPFSLTELIARIRRLMKRP
ncbi:MAG: response regulator [Lentisphaerae bacterium]|jgi:two-component system, cell cycle response regulator|nr:response regulator [Lentisphaerota bacterium]MBT4818588.1 response regulator [Lentisphaerota bacterium]MBT5608415.1 response regulator [Lentisphaerota bacterium]MBT7055927.1 response regulator [Lentisphaerota bacterium]MBT7846762.1 response regulator [Lentisphaerota bacterium]